jgi:purine-binding chemotaxis protein CheW
VVAGQEYGICTKQVVEVLGMVSITPLPTAPEFVEGVVNLRGRSTVVLSLRRKLGLEPAKPTTDSRIIVAEVAGKPVGIVADSICDVESLSSQDIDHPSAYPIALDGDFVFGVAAMQERLLVLLNLEHILSPDQKQLLSGISCAQAARFPTPHGH